MRDKLCGNSWKALLSAPGFWWLRQVRQFMPIRKRTATAATAFKHVLLISIDGMHALDFINCAQGISGC